MEIKDLIKGKVYFDNSSDGAIFDEENNHIADARGFGRFGGDQEGVDKHDFLAQFIADAINLKLEIHQDQKYAESLRSEIDLDICPHCKKEQKGFGDCADGRCYEC